LKTINLKTRTAVATVVFLALSGVAFTAAGTACGGNSDGTHVDYFPSHCDAVEIYDPIFYAYGEKGRNAGKTSVKVGCVPVCVWTASADNDGIIDADEISLVRAKAELETGSIEVISAASNEAGDELLFETETKFFDIDDDLTATSGAGFRFASGIAQVSVAPNQRHCFAYDITGDRVN